jgi:hypothetical protein
MRGIVPAGGPGVVSGDPQELELASSRISPVAAQVDGLAGRVSAQGGRAAGAAGSGEVAAAVSGLASAIAHAVDDTGLVLSHLGEVACISAASFRTVGSAVHAAGGQR